MTEYITGDEVIEVQENSQVDDILCTKIKDPYGFIYITTNLVNGKRYLGQKRFDDEWKNYLGSGEILKKAIKKYGKENFFRNIIDIVYSEDDLNQKEYEYSVFFDVVNSDNWYNLVYGGGTTRGYRFSDEQKQKLSKARKGRTMPESAKKKIGEANKGRIKSEETRNKISQKAKERLSIPENNPMFGKNPYANKTKEEMEALKQRWREASSGKNNGMYGKKHTEESKKKMSEAHKGKMIEKDNPFFGKKHTEETKAHLREINLGKKASQETKDLMSKNRKGKNNANAHPLYCYELGQFFWGQTDVKNQYENIPITNIPLSCKNKNRTCGIHPLTGERLHWRYATMEEYENYIQQNM